MKVKELIEILQACPPDAAVTTWAAFDDCESNSVEVGRQKDGTILISDVLLGTPIIPKTEDSRT